MKRCYNITFLASRAEPPPLCRTPVDGVGQRANVNALGAPSDLGGPRQYVRHTPGLASLFLHAALLMAMARYAVMQARDSAVPQGPAIAVTLEMAPAETEADVPPQPPSQPMDIPQPADPIPAPAPVLPPQPAEAPAPAPIKTNQPRPSKPHISQPNARPRVPAPQASPVAAPASPAADTAPPVRPSAPVAPAAPPPGWDQQIAAWIAGHKVYPDAARRTGEQGDVAVRFSVAPDGHIINVEIVQSSGSKILDDATIGFLRGASVPAPLMPLTRSVNLHYRIQ